MFSRRSLLKKTIEVAFFTLMSRFLAIIREALMSRYLGAGVLSDAFVTAFKLPNYIRKIFSEGALSAAIVPYATKRIHTKGLAAISGFMVLSLLVFESIVLIVCVGTMLFPIPVIYFFAPGFSADQIHYTVIYMRILMPLIFFFSISALFAGALQSIGHFFVSALSPALFNATFIIGLLISWYYQLPVWVLCWFVLGGGICVFIAHLMAYTRSGLSFTWWNREDMQVFRHVLLTFGSCFLSMGMMEINFIIDSQFVSFLPPGTLTMLYYANRFIGIPISVFAVAFATTLLPHFSRISIYAPRRLSYYLYESTKFVIFMVLPTALVMAFFSERIFFTIYLSDKFTLAQVQQTSYILLAYIIGLGAFAQNKILLNIYYALGSTWVPGIVSAIAAGINVLLNYFMMYYLQATGLALATSISAIIQMIIYLIMLRKKHGIHWFGGNLAQFLGWYSMQLIVILPLFYVSYKIVQRLIIVYALEYASFFLDTVGLWLWVIPLTIALIATLYLTRSWFNIDGIFLGGHYEKNRISRFRDIS